MIIGSKRIFFNELESTNSYLSRAAVTEQLTEGTIVHTTYQSSGKGQSGNKWESEKGKNLTFSLILYPSFISPSEQFLISVAISLGIFDFLKRHIDNCFIKWPNDIYVNNDKIAGILIEHSLMADKIQYTIAGIGLNINQERFISDAINPVSLKILTGLEYDLNEVLDQLAHDLDKRYNQLTKREYTQLREDYIRQIYRLNEWSEFKDSSGYFRGRLITVTDEGLVRVEKEGGELVDYAANLRYI
jgi:BirA family biotin operon repressor/biotin-[acetyl-CoA-carboxylase] ligase